MPLTDRQVRTLADQAGSRTDHVISAIAARQDGTIATRQMAAVGVSQPAVSRRVAAGRLHPMLTGVHAAGHPNVGRRGWWQAAQVNVVVCTYEIDLLWRERRLAVELDGRGSHGDGVAFERHRRRDATLAVAGWQVLRFTWRQVVNEPAWVAGTLRHVLAQGA